MGRLLEMGILQQQMETAGILAEGPIFKIRQLPARPMSQIGQEMR